MKKKVIHIGTEGFFEADVYLQDGEPTPKNCIEVEVPQGLHLPKWNGTEWVEGLSQEEIDEVTKVEMLPSQEDYLMELDFRLTMVEMGLL